jgi:gluconolactonase
MGERRQQSAGRASFRDDLRPGLLPTHRNAGRTPSETPPTATQFAAIMTGITREDHHDFSPDAQTHARISGGQWRRLRHQPLRCHIRTECETNRTVRAELDKIIGTGKAISQLADGVGGDNGPAEGPVWWKEGVYLLFSDINGNRPMKYTPGQGTVEFKKPTNGANGLTRDIQGRLVACEGAGRRVIREEHDGTITVIASSFQGRRLNRPNDVVVKSDGAIYFTNPRGNAVADQTDLSYQGVYRISADLGTLTLLVDDFIVPNGLAFSPDESILYINDTRRGHIRAFDIAPNGTLARQTDRVFADLCGTEPGVADGMKVDSAGNVYCGGSGGIWILDPKGKKLGRIIHGQPQTTNIDFGGPDWKTLYFTNWNFLDSVNLRIAGMPVPAIKKA